MEVPVKHFSVEFIEASGGWLFFKITADNEIYEEAFSYVYDPLPALKSWLEALSVGVEQASFQFELEGKIHKFNFKNIWHEGEYFSISESDDIEFPFIHCIIERKTLIKEFYTSLLKFATSKKYDPSEWEHFSEESGRLNRMKLSDFRSDIIESYIEN